MLTRAGAITLAAILVVLVAACGGSGASPGTASGSIAIKDAWARPAAAGGVSAAYFTIVNGQAVDDALTGVTTPAASAGIHETTTDASGMMGMHPVASVTIPAGGTVAFEPGGYHVMLMGLAGDLKPGDKVELQLTFTGGGTVPVTAEVREG